MMTLLYDRAIENLKSRVEKEADLLFAAAGNPGLINIKWGHMEFARREDMELLQGDSMKGVKVQKQQKKKKEDTEPTEPTTTKQKKKKKEVTEPEPTEPTATSTNIEEIDSDDGDDGDPRKKQKTDEQDLVSSPVQAAPASSGGFLETSTSVLEAMKTIKGDGEQTQSDS